ncbi:aldo/keto reductase [Proteiniphilum sp.]|uniref:aldo/keto reductase n=1 Tax=Proteiniphilum sp. TaxID=1926877 RepID=UPI002B1FB97E|nr:aldo/keto reductase [Proteiniphilum sp.]MEA4916120.1 aldo/keto reductase [Proteiniphilum sp.]
MDRRKFIKTGIVAGTLIGTNIRNVSYALPYNVEETSNRNKELYLDTKVKLGATGLTVPLMAMGSGTSGWNNASNQTRMGMEAFVGLARNAYNRGMKFFEMAESYGSHPFFGEAMKGLPREELTLLTKIAKTDGVSASETRNKIDSYRKVLGTDYIDIILMHCMTSGGWADSRQGVMEGLSRAKEEGIVKAVGISAHNLEALQEAVESSWVDVILARINPFQSHMDGTPETIKELLGIARKKGKGVIGMKIFGEGSRVKDEEREQSLRYALTESNIHSMTLGFQSIEQMNDAIERVIRIQKEIVPLKRHTSGKSK